MNKLSMLPIFLVISIMAMSLGSAAVSLNVGSVTATGNQKDVLTQTFTITNNGDNISTMTLTAGTLSHSTSTSTISSSAFTLSPSTVSSFNNGNSQQISVEIDIPDNAEVGTYTGVISIAYNDGVDETGTVTSAVTLTVGLGNHLIIKNVKVIGEQDSDSVNDNGEEFDFDKDEDPKPGEKVTIEIEIENDFSDNIEIDEIEITLENDDDLDWDEEEDVNSLDDGDEETITFELEIDEDVDDGTYDLEITLTGEDEDNNQHGETWTVELPITKEDDDLRFGDITFSPSQVSCSDNNVRMEVEIRNVGEDDQEEGVLLVKNTQLDYEQIIKNIEIDDGDEESQTLLIPLNNPTPGIYLFDLQVFTSSNDDDQTDVDVASLTINSCGTQTTTTTPTTTSTPTTTTTTGTTTTTAATTSTVDIITPTPVTTSNVVATSTGQPAKQFINRESGNYTTMLVIIAALLVVLIVLAGVAAVRK